MGGHANAAPVIIKRKKVVGGGGHHGGAWKVAYADFVTAMMAFFLLMWLLNATTEKQRKGLADYFTPTVPIVRVSGGGDGAFSGSSVFSEEQLSQMGTGATNTHPTESRQARGESGMDDAGQLADTGPGHEAFQAVQEALMGRGGESMAREDQLRHIVTRQSDEGLVIELFDLDGAPLFKGQTDQPTLLMIELSGMLSRVFALVENQISVAGHVAAQPIVRAENTVWRLSSTRADVVRALIEGNGTAPARLARVTGHADREPVTRDPMADRNNRIVVVLLRADP